MNKNRRLFFEKIINFKIVLFVVFFIFFNSANAQILFKKYSIPTWTATVFPQNDGTYRMIYNTVGYGGGCPSTIHFVKLDSAFNVIYKKSLTAGYCNMIYDVVQKNNEFLIGGFSAITSSDTGKRALMKIDLEGNLIWHGRFGNSMFLSTYTTFAAFAENDSALGIGVGYVQIGSNLQNGIYIYKSDGSGNLAWGKMLYTYLDISVGGKFIITHDGNYLISGMIGMPPNCSHVLIKTNSSGIVLWAKAYYMKPGEFCYFNRLIENDSGEIIIGGNTIDSTGNYWNTALVKCDSNGNVILAKAYNLNSFLCWWCDNFISTKDSGIAFISETSNYMTLFKLNSSLNIQWMKAYQGALQSYKLRQTIDDGFIFASYDPDSSGNDRYSYIKTDKYGESACNTITTSSSEYSIEISDSLIHIFSYNEGFRSPSNVTITNSNMTISTLCFCNPQANFSYSTIGNQVEFTNTSLNFVNALWDFGDSTNSNLFSPTHTYINSGNYIVTLIVEDGACKDTLTVLIQVPLTNILHNSDNNQKYIIFPNPNNGNFNIKYSIDKESEISIYNVLGQQVYRKYINPNISQTYEINICDLTSGIYEIKMTEGKNILFNNKIVISK